MGYTLSSEHIDAVSGLIEEFMSKAKTDQRSILRIRLVAESVLLKYQELFGPENDLSLKLVNRFLFVRICWMKKRSGETCNCAKPYADQYSSMPGFFRLGLNNGNTGKE